MAKSPRKMSRSSFALSDLAREVAAMFPPHLAEEWDNVGLQIGNPASPVRRVMTCLEVTEPTLAEARKAKVDAIVAHHPLIFRPMKAVLDSHPAHRLVAELVRSSIGLVVAHTNMDSAPWGTNQILAEACGLKPTGHLQPVPLAPPGEAETLKLVVFTPEGHERKVIEAIHQGGGGRIGLYSRCAFRAPGIGSFQGGEGSDPFIGKSGEFEEAGELRLEAVVPRAAKGAVLREVLAVHPYEEPAFDFYALEQAGPGAGLGCLAEPERPITLDALLRQIKRRMGIPRLRISGPTGARARREVRKVAICSGSGGSLIARAAATGADLYLTGEISYHHGVEAAQRDLTIVELGHYESERIMAGPLAVRLHGLDALRQAGVDVFAASRDFQPFETV